MAEQTQIETAQRLATTLAEVNDKCQSLIADYLVKAPDDDGYQVADPAVVAKSVQQLLMSLLTRPDILVREQMSLMQGFQQLWQNTVAQAMFGQSAAPVAAPAASDKRFKNEEWEKNPVFDFLRQSYLLTAARIESTVQQVDGLDPHTAKKAAFYLKQSVDAMSPSNFVATNPQVLKATLESGGENLVKGFSQLLDDMKRGRGKAKPKMTDMDAFQPGENIAITPGKVVFQNELMQLIQYEPQTEKVHKRPLLIVPPWINKFYILDLKPKNSFIKWAIEQGHTVFIISWVNPGSELSHKTFFDYLQQGTLAAIGAIEKATGEREINAIGYCIGGTLLACTLAYMAEKRDQRIKSATFFTSLLDFSDVGDLSVFIDDEQLTLMEKHMERQGFLEGSHMADAFNMLRGNDLIWSFVVNNYLLGREPLPFDLLYWNSDSTRMPAAMHGYYLRNMYLDNRLREPGGIELGGVPIDLRKVKTPAYFLSTVDDHIAPWKSTFAGSRLVSGPVRFVLGGSGHIAGVINPPAANKYGYRTSDKQTADPDAWLAGAKQFEGSWWTDWSKWIKPHTGEQVRARQPGSGKLAAIEDAPGSYVKVRAT